MVNIQEVYNSKKRITYKPDLMPVQKNFEITPPYGRRPKTTSQSIKTPWFEDPLTPKI